MGWKAATLRKKLFGNILGFGAVANNEHEEHGHGHFQEYFIDVLGILCALAYIIGCYCFYSPSPFVYSIGDWCFIISSVVSVGITVHTLLEQLQAMELEYPLRDSKRDELTETLMFLLAASCFSIGCIFFMPGLTSTAAGGYLVGAIGSWFCIIGSFGICLATLYNAMGFHADDCDHGIDEDVAHTCVNLTRYGMFILLVAGILFVVGSFMYRPVFGGTCPRDSVDSTCMMVKSYGTTMYLWGSYGLLTQGLLTLYVGVIKHSAEDAKVENKTLLTKHRRASCQI